MDTITLRGAKVLRSWKIAASPTRRITIELTENDSHQYAGIIAAYEQAGMCFDITMQPTEIEGENNVSTPKASLNIYQLFRLKCEEYSGKQFYKDVKMLWGVEHLRDLLKRANPKEVEEKLKNAIEIINTKMRGENIDVMQFLKTSFL